MEEKLFENIPPIEIPDAVYEQISDEILEDEYYQALSDEIDWELEQETGIPNYSWYGQGW